MNQCSKCGWSYGGVRTVRNLCNHCWANSLEALQERRYQYEENKREPELPQKRII